jgi:GNAT superfamily N-acetyltransferase
MAEPSIQLYDNDHRDAVLDVLADAYLTNPINMAVFGGRGPEQARQNRALFSALLEMLEGPRFVALHEGSVVGYVQWVSYPGCRPSREKAASIMPRLLTELADGVAARLTTWLRAWRERDPDAPHSHFGPIAVSPSRQGTGVGRLLMQHYCKELDLTMEGGYLETDRPENVGFYGKSGFEVTSEMELLGVRNWFMRRRARAA